MTYLFVYHLSPSGLDIIPTLCWYQDDTFKFIKVYYGIKNPYNEIYFIYLNKVFIDNISSKTVYIKTNVKPLWVSEVKDEILYIYTVRLLHEKEELFSIDEHDELILELVANKYLKNNVFHYFLTASSYFKRVYLFEPISKDEAIKIMEEYESTVLWEVI